MLTTFTASVRDGLSNLAASLGAGKDKASADAFVLRDLSRAEAEAMYPGDWLARKVVDIVPSDMCREWRAWSGERADVARMEDPFKLNGNLQAWRDTMTEVAEDLGTTLAWFDRVKFCLADRRRFAFGDLTIDRAKGGEPMPRDW